ncbi:unnamed protein product [Ectocarpus sp. CCAP 1310/34]|nr:unnamed protein product [Ectocarpus sp. CCAP 1310/34]
MAWRPGPRSSLGLGASDYDERDPWIQRFISKTDDGELSLDVNVSSRRNTMPCAAGSRCTAVPDHTPGPPAFTNHQCRGVCGQYLHGTCGVVDPQG